MSNASKPVAPATGPSVFTNSAIESQPLRLRSVRWNSKLFILASPRESRPSLLRSSVRKRRLSRVSSLTSFSLAYSARLTRSSSSTSIRRNTSRRPVYSLNGRTPSRLRSSPRTVGEAPRSSSRPPRRTTPRSSRRRPRWCRGTGRLPGSPRTALGEDAVVVCVTVPEVLVAVLRRSRYRDRERRHDKKAMIASRSCPPPISAALRGRPLVRGGNPCYRCVWATKRPGPPLPPRGIYSKSGASFRSPPAVWE